jgi:hypothetical protein
LDKLTPAERALVEKVAELEGAGNFLWIAYRLGFLTPEEVVFGC